LFFIEYYKIAKAYKEVNRKLEAEYLLLYFLIFTDFLRKTKAFLKI